VERVAEWAVRPAIAPVRIARSGNDDDQEEIAAVGAGSRDPGRAAEVARVDTGQVLVGTAAAVKDAGPVRLDVVGLLDPDRALARPGLRAGEQALATWMEASAWAGPRAEGGRVLVQTRNPGHPAVQALIRWEPLPFLLGDGRHRAQAGFPPGCPVFRLALREPEEGPGSESILRDAGAHSVLATAAMGLTLCLVAVRPESLPTFRLEILRLAAEGVVDRVEAEPHL
jgi:primosomal protein N' (replication factor Y)